MHDWERIRGLALAVEGHGLEPLERAVAGGTRRTTLVRLAGGGHTGIGEDVSYDRPDHEALQASGPAFPLAGRWTLGSFADHLAGLELFPRPPVRGDRTRPYRTYAYEAAALDLALRQAGIGLADAVGRKPCPVRYVVSSRLGAPPSLERLRALLARYPGLRLKLDATSDWEPSLVAELAGTGAVEALDLKGHYAGTEVDQPGDPVLYRRVVAAFADAWLEDPRLTPETDPILAAHRHRVAWDAPIHGAADLDGLPFAPGLVNVKPARVGALRDVFALYAACAARGIPACGGGLFELGPGRGQLQLLASLYHPDAPNDVAPAGFHAPVPASGLPTSPLAVEAHRIGFRWGAG